MTNKSHIYIRPFTIPIDAIDEIREYQKYLT